MGGQESGGQAAGRGEGLAFLDCPEALILVLGSFPSLRSLEKGEYYGNERNHFWDVLGMVFDAAVPADYAGRLVLLAQRRIAVWDVIAACERKGSLDKDIAAELPNPVLDVLASRQTISRIALNGAKAAASFLTHVAPELGARAPAMGVVLGWRPASLGGRLIKVARLPSTSPIPTRGCRCAADKVGAWGAFLASAAES